LLKVSKIESIDDLADLLTKPHPAYKLKQLLKICNPITKHIAIQPAWKELGGKAEELKLGSEEKFELK